MAGKKSGSRKGDGTATQDLKDQTWNVLLVESIHKKLKKRKKWALKKSGLLHPGLTDASWLGTKIV